MLVAVAVVGLLVGLVGPAAMQQLQSSRVKTTQAQIAQIRTALDIFQIDVGRMPTEAEGLEVLVANPSGLAGWNGPYLRHGQIPADGWNLPFLYARESGTVVIRSLGADGAPGGEGDDADIAG